MAQDGHTVLGLRPIDAGLRGYAQAPLDWRWDERDVALYAAAVGAGVARDLELLYERHGPRPLPTFATLAVTMLLPATVAAIAIDLHRLLHIEQDLWLAAPLPPSGRAEVSRTVVEVLDKERAAILTFEDVGTSPDGAELFRARSSWWVTGAGGFGGERSSGDRLAPAGDLPSRPPDSISRWRTGPDQAALYRLSGDLNPIHVDPEFARDAGFERPFLHGLCTLGAAALAVVRELCGGDPAAVRSIGGRFSGRVEPGDELTTELWRTGAGRVALCTRVGERAVLDRGRATLAP